jgi:hypothetical protein
MCKTCVQHCKPNCKINSIVFQHFACVPCTLCIFCAYLNVFRCFPTSHMCSAYVAHIFRIFSAYVANIVCISGPRTLFLHCVYICSAYVIHIFCMFSYCCTYFAHFPPPHTFSVFISHVSELFFTILSSEKRIVFAIFCAFGICCAYLRASQNVVFRISKFPNMTLRFHRLGVTILVVLLVLAILVVLGILGICY